MREPVVKISKGLIRGVQKDGYKTYFGIRYAKAPEGELRFRAPQEVEPWEGEYAADHFGAICPQDPFDGFYSKEFHSDPAFEPPLSEDCLFLNLWVPNEAEKGETSCPVAMYIHGGAFGAGFGSEMEFDGAAYAKRGVILVTINYRLGILGFLAHPWLAAENEAGLSGNYGILDQIAALKWIRDHIADFGGDPDNITVFGQSAGAMSTQTLCSSPLTKGMIAKAIFQSGGSYGKGLHYDLTPDVAMKTGETIMDMLNITSVEQLRAVSPKELKDGLWQYILKMMEDAKGDPSKMKLPMAPIVDGHLMEKGYYDVIDCGELHNIPYMLGSTSEDILVSPEDRKNGTKSPLYEGILEFSLKEEEIHNNPSYVYYFRHQLPGDEAGAFHSSELWYVFGTVDRCWRPLTEEDKVLSDTMVDYWTNFMKYGNPNGMEKTEDAWETYSSKNPYIKIFD